MNKRTARSAIKILDRVIDEILVSAKRWTQHTFARDKFGVIIPAKSKSATCFCLLGAMRRAAPRESGPRDALLAALETEIGDDVACWNDHPERTFREVKNALRRTRTKLQKVLA